MNPDDRLLDLVAAVVDGTEPDWTRVESDGLDESERRFLASLRIVAGVSGVHRSQPIEVEDERSTGLEIGGPRWGRFELLDRIGEGAFGVVYRARDPRLNRIVAVKLLKPEVASEERLVERLLREGRALAELHHENVVTVHEADVLDGLPGLCMEYIRGRSLEQQLATDGILGAQEAAVIGLQICRALAAVHGAGQVHRDVKPRNVMRAQGGRVVLMDFGAGIMREPTGPRPIQMGTPLYLAPEILAGDSATPQSDIYSLGVLLFHLVTGSYPVTGGSIEELREAHRLGQRRNAHDLRADLPDTFVRTLDSALAVVPSERFSSAGEFLSALNRSIGSVAIEQAKSDPAITPSARPLASRRRLQVHLLRAGLTISLIAIGAAAMWKVFAPPPPTPPAMAPVRIAVLPLRNLTGGPDWRVDAVTDDLMTTLGSAGLRVAGWTSVSAVTRAANTSVADIAKTLNVTWMLEGAIRPAPATDQAIVTLRLLRAGADGPEWTGSFTKSFDELFTVPRDVVPDLSAKMGVPITREARSHVTVPHSQNADARNEYLQGRFLIRSQTVENFRQGRQHFERAIQRDPSYALAHAALARCLIELEINGAVAASEARAQALTALNAAIALDNTLPDAYTHLGDWKLYYDRDWSGADVSYRRAVQLNPTNINARIQYSKYLAGLGRVDESVAEARVAEEADPVSPATGNLAMMLYYARRFDEAIALFQRRMQASPGLAQVHFSIGRVYAGKGAFDDAIRELEYTVKISGGFSSTPLYTAELIRTYAQAGRDAQARALLNQLEKENPKPAPSLRAYVGYIHAALKDKDRAFTHLDGAAAERAAVLLWAQVDPRLDGLRDDPRYPVLLRRLGLQ